MRSGRSGAGGNDLANERASRLFFFLCGLFWRHNGVEFSRHDGELLLAKERATAKRRPRDGLGRLRADTCHGGLPEEALVQRL
jgi:hypothetical protein